MRPRYQDAEPAIERVGGDPRFMWATRVSAAATTAASMRSRRLPGIPLSENTVSGIRDIVVDYSVGSLTLDTSQSRYAPALGSPSLGAHGAKSLSFAAEYGPGFTSKQTT